jgi:hypothetical protein
MPRKPALIDQLVAAGWLRPESPIKTGGRSRLRRAVNPRLSATAQSAQSAPTLSAARAVSARTPKSKS